MEFLYTRGTLSHTAIIRSIWHLNRWKFLRTRRRPNAYIAMTSTERLLHQWAHKVKQSLALKVEGF